MLNPNQIVKLINEKQSIIEKENLQIKHLIAQLESYKINDTVEDFLLKLKIETYSIDLYEIDEYRIHIRNRLNIGFELDPIKKSFLSEKIKSKTKLTFDNKTLIANYSGGNIYFDLKENNLLDIVKIFNLDIKKIVEDIFSHDAIDEFIKIVKMIDSLPLEFL